MPTSHRLDHCAAGLVEERLRLEDDERRRIARELHDTTGQNLLAARFELDRILRSTELPIRTCEALAEARARIDASITELRTLSYILYPPLLDEAGVGLALETLAEGFERRTGIQVDVAIEHDIHRCRWASEIELALYRVAQEALTNVLRHSGAQEVRISLQCTKRGAIQLIVEDQRGEDAMPDRAIPPIVEGVGIRSMGDRISLVGGSLIIARQEGGVRVTAAVPARVDIDSSGMM